MEFRPFDKVRSDTVQWTLPSGIHVAIETVASDHKTALDVVASYAPGQHPR
jgi:hypothetical protein